MEKKLIIRCAGKTGRKAIEEYGRDSIAFFCDDYVADREIEGIPVIHTEQLKEIHESYRVVVALEHTEDRIEMAELLHKDGISCTGYGYHEKYGIPNHTIHIYGEADCLTYDFNDNNLIAEIDRIRGDNTMNMYREMFSIYKEDFIGKNIDIHICIDDKLHEAYEYAKVYQWKCVHAYSGHYVYDDVIVPIPDYRACFNEEKYFYKDATPTQCKNAAKQPYTDGRAYWIGTLLELDSRLNLWALSKKYPNHLLVEHSPQAHRSMPDQAEFKYLIDVRGFGWTDRVKTLMMLGRPLLLADRPNKEWYMNAMEPMIHYVPVKEDFSDLIQKIDMLNADQELYKSIVKNQKRFVAQYLSCEAILSYLRDVTLKYDV